MAEKPITDLSAYPEFKRVLLDFVVMSENEIRRIYTGYAPGPAMRDCLGQWQYLVAEAKLLIARDVIENEVRSKRAAAQAAVPSPRQAGPDETIGD